MQTVMDNWNTGSNKSFLKAAVSPPEDRIYLMGPKTFKRYIEGVLISWKCFDIAYMHKSVEKAMPHKVYCTVSLSLHV